MWRAGALELPEQNRDFRLMGAERIGLGFELPGDAERRGQLLEFRKPAFQIGNRATELAVTS